MDYKKIVMNYFYIFIILSKAAKDANVLKCDDFFDTPPIMSKSFISYNGDS